jgi:hypothetical protein
MSKRPRWFLAAAPLLAVLLAFQPSYGQQQKTSRIGLAPRAGWLIPLGSLGYASSAGRFQDALAAAAGAPERIELDAGILVGATATFDVAALPVVWRVDVDHAPRLAVRTNERSAGYDASRTMVTAGIVTRTRGHVRPYALAGIGFRAYRFTLQETASDARIDMPPGGVNLVGRFGAGLELDIGSAVSLGAEAQTLPSTFRFGNVTGSGERTFQNDLAATLGLRIRVF